MAVEKTVDLILNTGEVRRLKENGVGLVLDSIERSGDEYRLRFWMREEYRTLTDTQENILLKDVIDLLHGEIDYPAFKKSAQLLIEGIVTGRKIS